MEDPLFPFSRDQAAATKQAAKGYAGYARALPSAKLSPFGKNFSFEELEESLYIIYVYIYIYIYIYQYIEIVSFKSFEEILELPDPTSAFNRPVTTGEARRHAARGLQRRQAARQCHRRKQRHCQGPQTVVIYIYTY